LLVVFWKIKRTLIVTVFLVVFSGCATTTKHHPIGKDKIPPNKITFCIKSSGEMSLVDKKISKEKSKELFKENLDIAVKKIRQHTQKYLESHFDKSNIHDFCRDEKNNPAFDSLYLEINLSGYGSLKEQWKRRLMALGVAEGVAQGIIVNSVTHNFWLSFGVATEEILSEYLATNGLDWIFSENYAPVSIEGDLFYSNNKKVIWNDWFFVTDNDDALNENDKKDKYKQLNASLDKAQKELFKSLNKYMDKEIFEKN